MTNAAKLPDNWKLASEEGKRRNWKTVVLVGLATAIVTGLLIFGLIELVYFLQNSSADQPSLLTLPDFKRNEDDFLRFEKDGDIGKITVDSLFSHNIVSVMPTENTTVLQSNGGFIVLKTQNGQIVVVNATNGSVTVYSRNFKVEVDTVQQNVSATGADGKIYFDFKSQSGNDGKKTIEFNIAAEDEKHIIIIKFLEGVTWVLSSGAIVAIADYETAGAPTVMHRSVGGMVNTSFEITPANGSTIFERRGSDPEFVLEPTNDVDSIKARMHIRPSRLYVVEKSAVGEVHVDLYRKSIFVHTPEVSNFSGWPFEPKFVKVVYKNITFNADFADGFGTYDFVTPVESMFGTLKNDSHTVRLDGGEFSFTNLSIVTASRGEEKLFANLLTNDFNMTNGVEITADGAQITSGPLSSVHRVNGTISKITSSIANLTHSTSTLYELDFASRKVSVFDERQHVLLESSFCNFKVLGASKSVAFWNKWFNDAVYFADTKFQLIGKNLSFKIERDNVAYVNGQLATVQINYFPRFLN